jgi:hypothetical protein
MVDLSIVMWLRLPEGNFKASDWHGRMKIFHLALCDIALQQKTKNQSRKGKSGGFTWIYGFFCPENIQSYDKKQRITRVGFV